MNTGITVSQCEKTSGRSRWIRNIRLVSGIAEGMRAYLDFLRSNHSVLRHLAVFWP